MDENRPLTKLCIEVADALHFYHSLDGGVDRLAREDHLDIRTVSGIVDSRDNPEPFLLLAFRIGFFSSFYRLSPDSKSKIKILHFFIYGRKHLAKMECYRIGLSNFESAIVREETYGVWRSP